MKCTVARLGLAGLAPLLEASEPVALAAGARPSRASDAVRLLTYNCWARVGHTATPPRRNAATPQRPHSPQVDWKGAASRLRARRRRVLWVASPATAKWMTKYGAQMVWGINALNFEGAQGVGGNLL